MSQAAPRPANGWPPDVTPMQTPSARASQPALYRVSTTMFEASQTATTTKRTIAATITRRHGTRRLPYGSRGVVTTLPASHAPGASAMA